MVFSTGARLEAILRDYMARLERFNTSLSPGNPTQSLDVQVKPMNLIVVTDGGELGLGTGQA